METFSALLAICAGNSPAPVNSLHKGQRRGALMLSLICAWINAWVNNGKAGDLRRHSAHYDVTVMLICRIMREYEYRYVNVINDYTDCITWNNHICSTWTAEYIMLWATCRYNTEASIVKCQRPLLVTWLIGVILRRKPEFTTIIICRLL